VQYYTDIVVNRPFMYVLNSIVTLKMRKHRYQLNDNLLGLNPSDEGKFFSIVKDDDYLTIPPDGSASFLCRVILDSRIDVYERTLRNSIDVLGDIGGLFEALNILIMLSVAYFVEKMFDHEINRKIYDYYNLNPEKRIGEESVNSVYQNEEIPKNSPSQFQCLQNEISQIKDSQRKLCATSSMNSIISMQRHKKDAENKSYTLHEELKEELKVPRSKKPL